jgi:hypothetical protein
MALPIPPAAPVTMATLWVSVILILRPTHGMLARIEAVLGPHEVGYFREHIAAHPQDVSSFALARDTTGDAK